MGIDAWSQATFVFVLHAVRTCTKTPCQTKPGWNSRVEALLLSTDLHYMAAIVFGSFSPWVKGGEQRVCRSRIQPTHRAWRIGVLTLARQRS